MNRINIIFDMDGVILDTEPTVINCWLKTADVLGLDKEIMERISYEAIGMNVSSTREYYNSQYSHVAGFSYDKAREIERKMFEEEVKKGIPLKKGARELLEYLKESGARIGLATSTGQSHAKPELEAVGLFSYFDELVYGNEVKNGKPHPEIYLTCASKLGVNPSETFAVEDSYNGIKSAHAAGMRTVMVPDCLPPTEETNSLCYGTFTSLLELKEHFQSLFSV